MITILGLIITKIEGTYMVCLNKHENLHFDDEHDIYMSSEVYEESDKGLKLHLPTILVLGKSRVLYYGPRRSGLVKKSNHLRPGSTLEGSFMSRC